MKKNFEYFQYFKTKDGISFILRPASPNDANIIQSNIQKVCDEQIYLYTDSFVLTKEWKKVLATSVDKENGQLLVLAEVNKEVVGHLRLFSPWYGQKGRHVGEIGLLIIQSWRESGIGTAMMNYALEWAKFANFLKLTASVFSTNLRALNLLLKFAFFEEGRRLKQFLINLQYIDEILLGRFLDNSFLV